MLILLFLAAAVAQDNPKTVNGNEIGNVEDFTDHGPARICLENAAIDLKEGESAHLEYAGIHRGIVQIETAHGSVSVSHGDSWANIRGRRSLLWRNGALSVYRIRTNDELLYDYYFPTDYSEGEPVMVLRVFGEGLQGNQRDLRLLRRISTTGTAPENCHRTYRYGWDMLFGDEPVSVDHTSEQQDN